MTCYLTKIFSYNKRYREEDTKWLSWMEIQFKKIAGSKGFIELEDFKKALGVKKVRNERHLDLATGTLVHC